jgi:hypothetical protein
LFIDFINPITLKGKSNKVKNSTIALIDIRLIEDFIAISKTRPVVAITIEAMAKNAVQPRLRYSAHSFRVLADLHAIQFDIQWNETLV